MSVELHFFPSRFPFLIFYIFARIHSSTIGFFTIFLSQHELSTTEIICVLLFKSVDYENIYHLRN